MKSVKIACVGVCLGLLLLATGCGSLPELEQRRIIQSIWNDGSKGQVVMGPEFRLIPGDRFPVVATVGPMSADSALPRKGDPKTHSYTLTGHPDAPIDIGGLSGEGAVALWDKDGQLLDKVAFVSIPKHAVLLRDEQGSRFCQLAAWRSGGPCKVVVRTDDTLSRLRTIRDVKEFFLLARTSGQQGLQIQEVKVLIDLQRDALPHFLNSRQYDLHYTWVRQHIEGKDPLNRCDAKDLQEFNKGWYKFSDENYYDTDKRRFLLATILYYSGPKKFALEFSVGDRIKYHQLAQTHSILQAHFPAPLPVRPLTVEQKQELFHTNEAKIPLMPIDLPYQGQTVQLLSPGVAYGTLAALSKGEVASHPLGLRTIALLKDVPNDINFVGGIISTHFQSALSHINVLSRNRGTPHLVIKDAANQAETQALIGKLVRLEVTPDGYTLREATAKEAQAFWDEKARAHTPWTPKRDLSVKQLVDLKDSSHKASPVIGAKAANLAELAKVHLSQSWHSSCKALLDSHGLIPTPKTPFAVPFYWYVDHLKRSGYAEKLEAWHKEQRFLEDKSYREARLAELRKALVETPLNPELLSTLEAEIRRRFGKDKVRFRSSTNVEDLPQFNGAGLYTSQSGQLDSKSKPIGDAIRAVWASLWATRAWSERQFYKIDQLHSAMGVLVHPSFPSESANGVAISTNIFRPDYNDTYVVAQVGEVSVVNPVDNSTPDQFLLRWYDTPETIFLSYSSLMNGQPVLQPKESLLLGCYMQAIHAHFKPIFQEPKKPFAMDVEFKFLTGTPSALLIKQARPYIFGEHSQENPHCKKP